MNFKTVALICNYLRKSVSRGSWAQCARETRGYLILAGSWVRESPAGSWFSGLVTKSHQNETNLVSFAQLVQHQPLACRTGATGVSSDFAA
jgi:hypothetical protein